MPAVSSSESEAEASRSSSSAVRRVAPEREALAAARVGRAEERGEDEEDKFWTKCYEPALPAPRRTPLGCGWLRHEVVANIFGGSAESIINYSKGYIRYVNLHVPTAQNGERPAAAVSCPCPTEEELMTTMSRDPKFEHLYGSKSCARHWRRRTRG